MKMFGMIVVLTSLAAYAYSVVILWSIFAKAGRRRWASVIPIYNVYVLLRTVTLPGWWVLLVAGTSVVRQVLLVTLSLEPGVRESASQGYFSWLFLLYFVVEMFFWYFVGMELAKHFGKSSLFGLGLWLLGPVFYAILAFGEAKYGHDPRRPDTYPGSQFIAVFNRELACYFATPLAYVFLVIFLFFSGYLTFKQGFYEMRQADLRTFFMNMPLLLVFMASLTAMRLWAEERRVGSVELLFALPVTITQAVLGKFLAAWFFLGIALELTCPMVITVCYLGNPDFGLIITGYIGSLLMAGGFLAIGCFFSAISKHQVISFVLSVVACALLVFAGMPTTLNYLSTVMRPELVSMIESMSFQAHFESMLRGVLEFRDLAYFVLLITGAIAACGIILNERKTA